MLKVLGRIKTIWSKGFTDFGSSGAQLLPGNTPFQSSEFRRTWYVRRVTLVHLEPGQQHEHTVVHRFDQVVDSTRWANSNAQSISGLTGYTMIVWNGALGHESTDASKVTYMPLKIDYLRSEEYSFGYLQRNTPSYVVDSTIPTAITNFDHMGETQDADMDNIDA